MKFSRGSDNLKFNPQVLVHLKNCRILFQSYVGYWSVNRPIMISGEIKVFEFIFNLCTTKIVLDLKSKHKYVHTYIMFTLSPFSEMWADNSLRTSKRHKFNVYLYQSGDPHSSLPYAARTVYKFVKMLQHLNRLLQYFLSSDSLPEVIWKYRWLMRFPGRGVILPPNEVNWSHVMSISFLLDISAIWEVKDLTFHGL